MRRKDEEEISGGWEDISLASLVIYELMSLRFAFLAQKILIAFNLIYGFWVPYSQHVQTEILCLYFFLCIEKGIGHTHSIFPFLPITQARNFTLFYVFPSFSVTYESLSAIPKLNLLQLSILFTPTITALIQVLIISWKNYQNNCLMPVIGFPVSNFTSTSNSFLTFPAEYYFKNANLVIFLHNSFYSSPLQTDENLDTTQL